jgi:hypothetical protein
LVSWQPRRTRIALSSVVGARRLKLELADASGPLARPKVPMANRSAESSTAGAKAAVRSLPRSSSSLATQAALSSRRAAAERLETCGSVPRPSIRVRCAASYCREGRRMRQPSVGH